jgi:hypothetical protein
MYCKSLFNLLLLLIISTASLAQGFIQKKIAQRRDVFTNNNWVGQDSTIWNYNSNQDILLRESKKFNNTWNNFNRDINLYGTNGKISQSLYQEFQAGVWKDVYQYNYIYDANNNEIELNRKFWNGTAWVDNSKYLRTYSATNKVLTETVQQFSGGTWVDAYKIIYTYDVTTDKLFEVVKQTNLGSSLVNTSKERYIFTPSDKIFEYTIFNPGIVNNWVHANSFIRNYNNYDSIIEENGFKDSLAVADYKLSYTYNTKRKVQDITRFVADTFANFTTQSLIGFNYNVDSLLIEKVYSTYPFGTQVLDSAEEYTYNNKNLVKAEYFSYQPGSKTLLNSYTYNYDVYNNRTYLLLQSAANGPLANARQEFYYYNQFPLQLSTPPLDLQLNVYPNPASDYLNLSFIEGEVDKLVQIFNLQGALVMSTKIPAGINKDVLPIAALSSGSYILKLQTHNGFAVSYFVKK